MLTLTAVIPITSSNRISPHSHDQRRETLTRNHHSSNATRTPPHTATADTKHNFDTDQRGANLALRLVVRPTLVLSDHTNVDELSIGPDSKLYQRLIAPSAPEWAHLVGANFTAWWSWQKQRGAAARSRMHDPLTLSAALGMEFVKFRPERIRVLSDGRTRRAPEGRDMQVSTSVDYAAFNEWLDEAMCA